MSVRTLHLHYTKAGLLIDAIQGWPRSREWISFDGKRPGDLRELVERILEIPTPNVPVGCPAPAEDGTCPGHEKAGT